MSDDHVDLVAAGYDRVADEYERLEAEEWPHLRRLRELLALLPDGADVLDAGCGNGVPALAALVERRPGDRDRRLVRAGRARPEECPYGERPSRRPARRRLRGQLVRRDRLFLRRRARAMRPARQALRSLL